jgi:hypothetical protein
MVLDAQIPNQKHTKYEKKDNDSFKCQ